MKNIRSDFPIFKTKMNEQPLIYLDSAATSQKPQTVIDAIADFYTHHYGPIGRSIYPLAEQATAAYESARATVAQFLNAQNHEIIFNSGTTFGMNFIALTYGRKNLKKGDEIVLTELEHHSSLLPWLALAQEKELIINYIPVSDQGTLEVDHLDQLITKKTKIVIFSHVSNVFGGLSSVEHIVKRAKAVNAVVVLDAAQSVAHQKIDVKKLDIDFFLFSGHKILGPTGIGVLYMHERMHEITPPLFYGGGMVNEASFESMSIRSAPQCYEAGTPAFAQAIGLAAAIQYINKNIDFNQLQQYHAHLMTLLLEGLHKYKRVHIVGPQEELKKRASLVSFYIDGIHAHDAAAYFAEYGICVRAGNLCAQPLAQKLNIPGLMRISFYAYNTESDVKTFLIALEQLLKIA